VKAVELALAVLAALCGAGAVVCAVKGWDRAGDFLSGAGLFLCSVWLLLRTA
jgi:hypothetical protein